MGRSQSHSRTLILGTIRVLLLKSNTITAYFYDARFDESKSMIMPKCPITSTTQGIQKNFSKNFKKIFWSVQNYFHASNPIIVEIFLNFLKKDFYLQKIRASQPNRGSDERVLERKSESKWPNLESYSYNK